MAGGKETPRQRMIGILYLVLLGLIALSVPDSLMDAFKNIKNSLDQSTKNVNTSLETTYNAFEATKLKEQPEKAQALLKRAKAASQASADLNSYVEELKTKLIEAGGGMNEALGDVEGRDNLDVSPRMMITEKRADDLKKKIDDVKAALLNQLDEKDREGVNFSLSTAAPAQKPGMPDKTWQEAYFGEGIPLGATLTTLAKIQADNKNAENEVVKKILGKIDQAQITLNTFMPVIAAPSSYIIQGQPYTAKIYLSAFDKNSNPTITVDGGSVTTTDGVGNYTVTASGEGKHTIHGSLSVKQVDGPPKSYPFTADYTVSRPSAVVSADKMNVLYIGVPNPISVSAPGVPKESIKVSIAGAGGDITGSNGTYTATVKSVGDAKIAVTGDKGQALGFMIFHAKRIPPPKAQFAGKGGGNSSAANLRAADRVFAVLDNFDFEAKFNVTHYQMLIYKPRADTYYEAGSGSELTPGMKRALSGLTPGCTIVFQNITAVGPDGLIRDVDAIVLTAN